MAEIGGGGGSVQVLVRKTIVYHNSLISFQ